MTITKWRDKNDLKDLPWPRICEQNVWNGSTPHRHHYLRALARRRAKAVTAAIPRPIFNHAECSPTTIPSCFKCLRENKKNCLPSERHLTRSGHDPMLGQVKNVSPCFSKALTACGFLSNTRLNLNVPWSALISLPLVTIMHFFCLLKSILEDWTRCFLR